MLSLILVWSHFFSGYEIEHLHENFAAWPDICGRKEKRLVQEGMASSLLVTFLLPRNLYIIEHYTFLSK